MNPASCSWSNIIPGLGKNSPASLVCAFRHRHGDRGGCFYICTLEMSWSHYEEFKPTLYILCNSQCSVFSPRLYGDLTELFQPQSQHCSHRKACGAAGQKTGSVTGCVAATCVSHWSPPRCCGCQRWEWVRVTSAQPVNGGEWCSQEAWGKSKT